MIRIKVLRTTTGDSERSGSCEAGDIGILAKISTGSEERPMVWFFNERTKELCIRHTYDIEYFEEKK